MQLDPNDLKKTINNAAHSFQEKTGKKGKNASAPQGEETPSPDKPSASGQDGSAGKNGSPEKLTRRQKKSRRSRRSGKAAKSDRSARPGQPHQSEHPGGQKAEPGQKAESGQPHQNEHPGGQTKQSGALKAGIAGKTKKGLFQKKERSPEIQVPDAEDAPSQKHHDRKELWAGPAQKISETVRKMGINPGRRKASEDVKALQETDTLLTEKSQDQAESSGTESAKTQDSPKASEKAKAQDQTKESEREKAQDQTKVSEKEKAQGRSRKSRRARKKERSKRSERAKTQDRSKTSEPVKSRSRSIVSETVKDSGKTQGHLKSSASGTSPETEAGLLNTSPETADIFLQEQKAAGEAAAWGETASAEGKASAEAKASAEEKADEEAKATAESKASAEAKADTGSPVSETETAAEKEKAPEKETVPEGETSPHDPGRKSESENPETVDALSGEAVKASEEISDGGLKTQGRLSELPARGTGFLRNLWVICVTGWKALFASLVKKVGYTLAAAGVIAFIAALFCCILYLSTMGSRSGQAVDSGGRDREEMAPEEGAEADYDGIAPADEAGTTGWSQVLPDQTAGTDGDQALAKAFEGLFSRTRQAAVVLRQQAENTIRDEYMEILESGKGSEFTPESEAQKKLWEQVRQERKENLKEKPLLILVNKWHTLPEDYVVEPVDLENGQQISSICYDQMVEMLQDCRSAGGTPIVCSGYRPHETQVYLFDEQINRWLYMGYGQEEAEAMAATAVAVPGTSEHELGLAADIYSSENMDLDESQVNTFTQQWLMEHCWEYGFVLRYPNGKSSITGIIFEPWHYRYVGRKYAEKIHKAGVCLEEYLDEAEHPYSPLDPFAETAEETGDGTGNQSGNGSTDGTGNGSWNDTSDGTGDGFWNNTSDGTGDGFRNNTSDGTGDGSWNDTSDGTGDGSWNDTSDGTGNGSINENNGGTFNGY